VNDGEEQLEALSLPATSSIPREGRKSSSVPRDGSSSSTSRSSIIRKRKRRDNDDKTTEVLHLAGEKLKALQSEDSFDVYGKHVAYKLRGLKGNQTVFTRTLINGVLFEADMEALTRDFKVINCR
jgi:hypothetical protein